jgi:hypothetical protein
MFTRPALFFHISQHIVVVQYRCFGQTYRPRLQGSRSPKKILDFLALKDVTDMFSRNVGTELTLYAANMSAKRRSPLDDYLEMCNSTLSKWGA